MSAALANESEKPEQESALHVALLIPHEDPFWRRLVAFSDKAASDLGLHLTLYNSKDSPDAMLENAKVAIAAGVNALIVAESQFGAEAVLQAAEEAQVPVIVINATVSDRKIKPRTQYDQWIGSVLPNDVQVGATLARQLIEMAKARGEERFSILGIAGNSKDESARDREQGLRDFFRYQDNADLTIIPADWDPEKATQVFVEAIKTKPDINVVWCANDNMARAVAKAIAELELDKPPLVGGVDWDVETAAYLEAGDMTISVGGHFLDGAWALVLLHDYLKGFDFARQKLVFNSSMLAISQNDIERYKPFFGLDPYNLDFSIYSLVLNPNKRVYSFELDTLLDEVTKGQQVGISNLVLTKKERDWLAAHQTIRVINGPDYAPFDFMEGGKPKGFSIDYINLLAGKLGLELQFVQDSWPRLYEKAKKGEIDLLHSIFNSPVEREKFFVFSKPYKQTLDVLVTRVETDSINTLDDVRSHTIALVKSDSIMETLLKKFPNLSVLPTEGHESALKAVAFGRADATFMELSTANYLIRNRGISNLKIVSDVSDDIGRDSKMRLAVRKDWVELMPIIEKAMESITPEELAQLESRWFTGFESQPTTHSETMGLSQRSIILLFGVLLAIVVAIYLSYRILERSNQNGQAFQFASDTGKRVVFVSGGLLVVIVLMLGSWALQSIEEKVKQDIKTTLQTVLQTTLEAMNLWANDQKNKVDRMAENERTRKLIVSQIERYERNDVLRDSPEQQALDKWIYDLELSSDIDEYIVIARDGVVVASDADSMLGKQNVIQDFRPEILNRVFRGETVMIPPVPAEMKKEKKFTVSGYDSPPTMFFAAPVKNDIGDIVAVLAMRYDPHGRFSRINILGRLGESGETYAFDQAGRLISSSRFLEDLLIAGLIMPGDQSILSIEVRDPGGNLLEDHVLSANTSDLPLTVMAESAIGGRSGFNVEGYRDYRGVPVLGAWVWDESLRIGMTTEIDQSEAMASYELARYAVSIILAVTLAVSIAMTIFTMLLGSRANRALKQAHDSLEENVALRTKELSDANERLALIMESAQLGLWEYNLQTQVFLSTDLTEKLFGYSPNIMLDNNGEKWRPAKDGVMNILRYCHPDERDALRQAGIKMVNLEARHMQESFRFMHANGEWRWVQVIAHIIEDDDPTRSAVIYGVLIDIHDMKNLQLDLMRARDIAQQASLAKSEFLASMSHEIRTPMNGVLGMLELLMETELSEEQRKRAEVAQSSAESLLSLINDILDFSKVEAGKLEIEEVDFDLRELLGDVARSLAHMADKKGLELVLDLAGISHQLVKSDSSRIRQIITNLMSNAVKFTHEGEIVLKGELKEAPDGQLKFVCQVRDTGIGIDQEHIDRLFDSFTQADASTTRKYGGSGLGLAICRRLCMLMGGDISVTSVKGEGSCFEFYIMLQAATGQIPEVPKADVSQLKVLVVDDNDTNREIFTSQLESWHCTVESAENAEIGLMKCIEHLNSNAGDKRPFDVAILDMQMPDIDGETLARQIRGDARLDKMHLVLMSSIAQQTSLKKLANIGFSGSFAKPVTPSDLFDCLAILSVNGDKLRASGTMITRSYLQTAHSHQNAEPEIVSQSYRTDIRVLIVEDNQVNQLVVRGILEGLGISCHMAFNGQEAIQQMIKTPKEVAFDLIFMDCQMPEMDGYEATRRIRAGQAGIHYKDAIIIALTAHAMQGDREKCIAAGMNDFMSKPIQKEGLENTLKRWMGMDQEDEPSINASTPATDANLQSDQTASLSHENPLKRADLNSSANKSQLREASDIMVPPELHTIDFSKSKPGIADIPDAYLSALSIYARGNQDYAQQLTKALNGNNVEAARQIVHAIKGTSGNLGMQSLYEEAAIIEKQLIANEEPAANAIEDFLALVAKSIDDAERIVAVNQPDEEVTDTEETRPFSEVKSELIILLKQNELVPKELIMEVKVAARHSQNNATLTRVAEVLEAFDYDEALLLLEKIES